MRTGGAAGPTPSRVTHRRHRQRRRAFTFVATLQTHTRPAGWCSSSPCPRVVDRRRRRAMAPAHHSSAEPRPPDPLPSWNDGGHEEGDRRLRRPRDASTAGRTSCPLAERIATFDNDGTLWSEQPIYFQLAFALDRVKALAPKHPEWKQKQPFKGVLEGDMKAVAASGEKGLLEVMAATHVGNTTDEFATIVTRLDRHRAASQVQAALHRARVPADARAARLPAGERLQDLHRVGRRRGVHAPVGRARLRHSARAGRRQPRQGEVRSARRQARAAAAAAIDLVDDKAGKPVGIHQVIGRRPIMAFGNSDGDFEMLEWTTSAPGPRFGLIVHHTDAEREWAYDRDVAHRSARARPRRSARSAAGSSPT